MCQIFPIQRSYLLTGILTENNPNCPLFEALSTLYFWTTFAHSEVFHVARIADHILRLFTERLVRFILLQIGNKRILIRMILRLFDSLASTMHAYFHFLASRLAQISSHFAFPGLTRHGCFHRHFQLFPRVLDGFFELKISRINKVDASQSSCIVELRFFDCPLLLLLSLSCFGQF